MRIILRDAERWPKAFDWFGEIPAVEIEEWLDRNRLTLPQDLIELWQRTGGGDVFESETILRPTVPSVPSSNFVDDAIESFNPDHGTGSREGLYIFQRGAFISAIRLRDQRFVTLGENGSIHDQFSSLDEWYVRTLRAEFGTRFGLDPILRGK